MTIKHHTLEPFGQVAMVIIFACKDGFLNLQTLLSTNTLWLQLAISDHTGGLFPRLGTITKRN